jgi:hypothetical protein
LDGGAPTVCILHAENARRRYEEALGSDHPLRFFPSLAALGAFEKRHAQPGGLLPIANLRPRGETILDWLRCPPPGRPSGPWIAVGWADDLTLIRECYALGAAEYLSAPPRRAELKVKVARVARLLERGAPPASALGLEVDPVSFTIGRSGLRSEALTAKEFQILSLLARAAPRGVRRAEIRAGIWRQVHVGAKTLEVHLAHLRRKLAPLELSICVTRPGFIALVDSYDPATERTASNTGRPLLHRMHRRAQPCRRSSFAGAEPFPESAPAPL